MATYQLDVDSTLVARWVRQGFLIPRLPRVYAVAGASGGILTALTEAILYAGPDAMLDGPTAGWWVGALREPPPRVTVSTPHRCRSIATRALREFTGIDVHERRTLEPVWLPQDGRVFGRARHTAPRMPLTPMPQLALDLAAALESGALRRALANLEYRRLVDKDTLEREACGRGRRGSGRLRDALERPLPQLATTRSPSEEELLFVLEARGVQLPDETDTFIGGEEVDAVWHAAKLIVEIDGRDNHETWSQINRDRRKELRLRALGYVILRYTAEQLRTEPERIASEIARHLLSSTARSA